MCEGKYITGTETLKVKVGEQFQIKGTTASHINSRLVFPEEAFKLVEEHYEPLPEKKGIPICGSRPKRVFTLEALAEGNCYFVEFQGLNPGWKRNQEGLVAYAYIYHINVRRE